MIKYMLIFTFFLGSISASISNSILNFTDYETNATLHLVNYYSYTDINNIIQDDVCSVKIITNRYYVPYSDIVTIFQDLNYNDIELNNLRLASHLVDWSSYSNDFGINLQQTNFLFGLSGVLIGFVFLFGFVNLVRK